MSEDATVVVSREDRPPAEQQDLPVGARVNDRFVIESILGRGGMGVVYRALDLRKQETGDEEPYVALKVLSTELRDDQRMVIALQREARKVQTLAHPNIATVYDFDRDGNMVYLTMEELDGQPLDELLSDNPEGLSRADALPIIRGLCLGLAYANNKGIIHSDFKPPNIFLTADKQTRILDFGIARAAPGSKRVGGFDAGDLGALTPGYASLEMFKGEDPHPADDVYALALVTYQLLTGRHPFDNAPAPQAKNENRVAAPIKGIKRREWRAIQHGLAFDRADRSQHAADFLREFERRTGILATAAALAVGLVATTGYVAFTEYEKTVAARPDVAFESLDAPLRSRITDLIDEGDVFFEFGDPAAAMDLYLKAYDLHARNTDVVARLDRLAAGLSESTLASGDKRDIAVVHENLSRLISIDSFLGSRDELVDAVESLEQAL